MPSLGEGSHGDTARDREAAARAAGWPVRWSSATIIGSGIFLLPPALAPFGRNAIYAWPLTIAGALCLAWVFAQAGVAALRGGPYAYVARSIRRAARLHGHVELLGFASGPGIAVAVAIAGDQLRWQSSCPRSADPSAAPTGRDRRDLAADRSSTARRARGRRRAAGDDRAQAVPLIAVVAARRGPASAAAADRSARRRRRSALGAIAAAAALTLFSLLGFEAATVAAANVTDDPPATVPARDHGRHRASSASSTCLSARRCCSCCPASAPRPRPRAVRRAIVRRCSGPRPAAWLPPVRRHQRVRRLQRLDPAPGEVAAGDGPRRRPSTPGSPRTTAVGIAGPRPAIVGGRMATLLVAANYQPIDRRPVHLHGACRRRSRAGALFRLRAVGAASAAARAIRAASLVAVAVLAHALSLCDVLRRRARKRPCGALALLVAGLPIYCVDALQFPRAQPGAGGRSSRASGISRRSFCAKLRRQTSLVPSGPAI